MNPDADSNPRTRSIDRRALLGGTAAAGAEFLASRWTRGGNAIAKGPSALTPDKSAVEAAIQTAEALPTERLFELSDSFRYKMDSPLGGIVEDPMFWLDYNLGDYSFQPTLSGDQTISSTRFPSFIARLDSPERFMPHKGIVYVPHKGIKGSEVAFEFNISVIPVAREEQPFNCGGDPLTADILYCLIHANESRAIVPIFIGWKNDKTDEASLGGYGLIGPETRRRHRRDMVKGAAPHPRDERLRIIDENLGASVMTVLIGSQLFSDELGPTIDYPPIWKTEEMTRTAAKNERFYRALANLDLRSTESSGIYGLYSSSSGDLVVLHDEIGRVLERSGNDAFKLPSWKKINHEQSLSLDELLETIPHGTLLTVKPTATSIY